MDAFEMVVAAVLERNGYWTRTSVKVELTREEKQKIKRPSSPRWELDVVAYKGARTSFWLLSASHILTHGEYRIVHSMAVARRMLSGVNYLLTRSYAKWFFIG